MKRNHVHFKESLLVLDNEAESCLRILHLCKCVLPAPCKGLALLINLFLLGVYPSDADHCSSSNGAPSSSMQINLKMTKRKHTAT